MPRKTIEPRYIKPESIHIGDTVRIVWEVDDTERTATGKVAKREHYGATTGYYTASGVELFMYNPGQVPFIVGATIKHVTLLDRSEPDLGALPLFEMSDENG